MLKMNILGSSRLPSYATSTEELQLRRAPRGGKILFVVNFQAAKLIGLTIPPNVLVRANQVIK